MVMTTYFGTDAAHGKSTELASRLDRTYELAGFALLMGNAPSNTTLVHGLVHHVNAPEPTRYAWLELVNGDVWDPVTGELWMPQLWDALFRPIVKRRFTREESRLQLAKNYHWGPWL